MNTDSFFSPHPTHPALATARSKRLTKTLSTSSLCRACGICSQASLNLSCIHAVHHILCTVPTLHPEACPPSSGSEYILATLLHTEGRLSSHKVQGCSTHPKFFLPQSLLTFFQRCNFPPKAVVCNGNGPDRKRGRVMENTNKINFRSTIEAQL